MVSSCHVILLSAFVIAMWTREANSDDTARLAILKFAATAFLEHDMKEALQFVDPTAERKTNGPSSLVPFLEDPIRAKEAQAIGLKSVTFFSADDVASLSERFPSRLWSRAIDWRATSARAVVVLEIVDQSGRVREKPGAAPMVILGADVVDGVAKIVFWDDN